MKETEIRILAWPRTLPLNSYFERLNEGLQAMGFHVEDFTYRRALAGKYDILHVHFPNFPFRNPSTGIALARLCIVIMLLSLAKIRGRKIAWTLHNLADHEQFHPRFEAAFMTWFTRLVDLTINLSDSGQRAAFERFPSLVKKASTVIRHLHYGVPDGPMLRTHALAKLGLPTDAVVLLSFGAVRRYKNIPELIKSFRNCRGDFLRLVIAGTIRDPVLEQEIRALALDPRIVVAFGPVLDEALTTLITAATLCVAPYRDILNSGSAFMSLTHARPILLPDLGAMAELQSLVGAEWIRLYKPQLTADVLATAIEWARRSREVPPDLTAFAPEAVIAAHAEAFRGMLGEAIRAPQHRGSRMRSMR